MPFLVNENKIHSAANVLSGDFHFVCECCRQRASVGSDDTSAIVTHLKGQQQFRSFLASEKMKKAVLHKLCENAVVHAGGTTNLKNHSLFGIFGEFNKLYKKRS